MTLRVSSLFQKFPFEKKQNHIIWFWSTITRRAEKPEVIMRLSLHGTLIWRQSEGDDKDSALEMALASTLPSGPASCILQRWYHRCPPPHQLWAWWPDCRYFLVPCGWTVNRNKLKMKHTSEFWVRSRLQGHKEGLGYLSVQELIVHHPKGPTG